MEWHVGRSILRYTKNNKKIRTNNIQLRLSSFLMQTAHLTKKSSKIIKSILRYNLKILANPTRNKMTNKNNRRYTHNMQQRILPSVIN